MLFPNFSPRLFTRRGAAHRQSSTGSTWTPAQGHCLSAFMNMRDVLALASQRNGRLTSRCSGCGRASLPLRDSLDIIHIVVRG